MVEDTVGCRVVRSATVSVAFDTLRVCCCARVVHVERLAKSLGLSNFNFYNADNFADHLRFPRELVATCCSRKYCSFQKVLFFVIWSWCVVPSSGMLASLSSIGWRGCHSSLDHDSMSPTIAVAVKVALTLVLTDQNNSCYHEWFPALLSVMLAQLRLIIFV